MPLNQNLLKKNILLSLQILWEIAVTVGGKQMENAFVYIKLWHVQEASSTPHPELRVWAQASGGRKGVICILWGDWVGAKGQTDYHWQLCIWEPAQWEVESKQWKWPGKQMEPKSLGGCNQVTAALVGTQAPMVGKDTTHVLVKKWHKRNWSSKIHLSVKKRLQKPFC